jgi:hypothetical protein
VTDLIEKIENLRSTLSEVEIIQIIRITYHSFTSSKLHHLRLMNSGKNRTNTYDYFIAKVYDIYNYNLGLDNPSSAQSCFSLNKDFIYQTFISFLREEVVSGCRNTDRTFLRIFKVEIRCLLQSAAFVKK